VNENGRGASLYHFRDLDLLQKILKEVDESGWIETSVLAGLLGLGEEHHRHVGIRLAWMRRFGMIERDEQKGLWRLSRGAVRVVDARLRAVTAQELLELDDAAMVEVMASVISRYRLADPMTATMLRREFMFGTQR
jgi:hypothetical protein